MLQSIRDRTQGWISGVIISLVIISFALWGIHSYMIGSSSTDVAAKVNGTDITKKQLAAAYERLRRQSLVNAASNGTLPDQVESTLKQRALDALINIEILKQASIDENYHVTTRQVDSYLESMPEFQNNGQFSLRRFQQLLATTLFSPSEFLNLIKTTLLIDQPRLGMLLSSIALPYEVTDTVSLVNQERDIEYLSLPRDALLKQPMVIPDDEIKTYYQQHQNEFKTPEQASVEYISLSIADLIKAIHPTDEALKNFYKENINTYTHPMQWGLEKILIPASDTAEKQVADIMKKIHTGADFATLAFQHPYSDKPQQGWITLNEAPAELQKALPTLTKVGQVSEPVHTPKGIVVLKAIGVKPTQILSFDEVKDKVREAVARPEAEAKFADFREKLANLTYEYPDSLQPAAKELGLTIKTTELFTQDKEGKDIANNKKVRQAAFSDDVLNSQNNSDVIQISPDDAIVLRIKSHLPASVLSLTAVRGQIVDKLKVQKAETQVAALATEIQKKLQHGATPDQIATLYHTQWDKVGYIGRYSTKVDSAILYTAFRLPRPKNAKDVTYSSVKIPTGYAVVATMAVRDGDLADKQDQYDVFADQVQNSDGLLEYKLYVKSLTKRAKITSDV